MVMYTSLILRSKLEKMKNAGIIDRLIRLVLLHLVISIVDTSLIDSDIWSFLFLITGFYLIATMLSGIDPFYKLCGIDTREDMLNKKTI